MPPRQHEPSQTIPRKVTRTIDPIFWQVEEYLGKVVQLFSYLTDKDLFAEIYRNQLAKRLLNQRSASDDMERLMIGAWWSTFFFVGVCLLLLLLLLFSSFFFFFSLYFFAFFLFVAFPFSCHHLVLVLVLVLVLALVPHRVCFFVCYDAPPSPGKLKLWCGSRFTSKMEGTMNVCVRFVFSLMPPT